MSRVKVQCVYCEDWFNSDEICPCRNKENVQMSDPGLDEFMPKSPGHPDFLRILEEMKQLHIKKSEDYGLGSDPLNNLRGSEEIGIPAWKGCWNRARDKIKRINVFCVKNTLANESVEDSLLDLASYSILTLILFREIVQKNKQEEPEGSHREPEGSHMEELLGMPRTSKDSIV